MSMLFCLLEWIKYKSVFFVVFSLCGVSVCSAAAWPSRINLVNPIGSPAGTILWEMPINVTKTAKSSSASKVEVQRFRFKVKGAKTYDINQSGNIPIGSNSGVYLAFLGEIRVLSGTRTICSHTKSEVTGWPGLNYDATLIGCTSDSNYAGNQSFSVKVTGRIVLFKDREEISTGSLSLPQLTVAVQSWQGSWGTEVNAVTGQTTVTVTSRQCRVDLGENFVDFGSVRANESGEISRRASTFHIACTGNDTYPTSNALIQITPTYPVNGDTRAIGVKFNNSDTVSDQLLIRAFLDTSSGGIGCGSSSAVVMDIPTAFATVPSGTSASTDANVWWLLCRKDAGSLPTGRFNSSAVVKILFQ